LLFAQEPAFHRLAHFSLVGFTGLSAAGGLLDVRLMPLVHATTAALGLGLSGASILAWIQLRHAFVAMLALGALWMVCINRIVTYLGQK